MQQVPVSDFTSKPLEGFVSPPLVVDGDDRVSDVIGKLVSGKKTEAIINLESKLGMLTVRSILRSGEFSETKASTLAIIPPALVVTDPVWKAAKVMSDLRVRSVPVTDGKGKLRGSIESTRILGEAAKTVSPRLQMSEIMTANPVTIDYADSLDKARSVLIDKDIDHLPVVKNGKLAGLVTSLDIITVEGTRDNRGRISKLPEPTSQGVVEAGGALLSEPIVSRPNEDSLLVLRRILEKEASSTIVMLNDQIRGIATLRDYAKLLTVHPESKGPPVYVIGLPETDFESSMAETKFRRAVEGLSELHKDILEARATVKPSSLEKDRRRYEVDVLIARPKERIDFTEEGWSIAEVFDKVHAKIKRHMTKPRGSPAKRRRRLSRAQIELVKYGE
ncbi:MAG TPA: CBS domain-containing protein [Candidatus Bathyarchaeia archaeon]|nr:CBS domain-containing protein [Candidatus Bathyarchaeia archaeon]